MPPKLDLGVRESVLTLSSLSFSSRKIVKVLGERNIIVSQSAVTRVIREKSLDDSGEIKPPPDVGNRGKPKKRLPTLIKKVKKDITGHSPLTQNQLARKHKVSQTTIHRIIHDDLHGELRKKCRVHALSDAMISQRLERGPRFLKWIEGRKWENVLTIDEAWVYLTHCNGRRKVYYEFKGERSEESWTKVWKESHPKGVMFVAGVCSRGKTKIRFVEPGAKINSQYYIENVLTPIFAEDVPRLFPGTLIQKAVFHHDSAPAHASKATQKFLESQAIKFIPKEDWMGNSPDLSPMDYCVNGIFKWELFSRAPTTVVGLKRVMTSVWDNLDQKKIKLALRHWPDRVNLMPEKSGGHIEHVLAGGKKF